MLRRCRLCARTLGAASPSSSRSLAVAAGHSAAHAASARTENYHHQQQQQQQHQPVASTSKLAYTGDNLGSSSYGTRSTRRRYSSADAAFASDAAAAADSEQTSSNNDHRFASTREYGFRRSSALSAQHSHASRWKGKARAVDEHDAISPRAAATAPPMNRDSQPTATRDDTRSAIAHMQVSSEYNPPSVSPAHSPPATPAAASTSAPLESDLAADIQSQAHTPNTTAATADEISLISAFQACLEQKDFIASLHSLVRTYLYRYERDRPDFNNVIGMMAQKLQTVFADQPRTNALKLIRRTSSPFAGTSPSTPPMPSLEIFLQMLFRAVMDQNDYRTWKKALQRVLKRTADLLIRQEGLQSKASNTPDGSSTVARLEQCFLAIIRDLRAARRWESAAQLAQLYVHLRDGAWSAPVLEQYLEANHQLGRHELAPRLHALPTAILPLSERTYGLLLRAHLAARNLEAASAVRRSMHEHGIKPSSTTYNYIFSSYKTLGGTRALLADVDKLGLAYDTDLANALLACAIKQDGLPVALETIGPLFRIRTRQSLEQISLPRPSNADVSPSVIAAPAPTAASKRSTRTPVLVPTVQSRAGAVQGVPTLQPNQATYNLLVRGYADIGNFEAALDLCTEMEEEGFRRSPFVTSALLEAFRPRTLATSATELPALAESTTSEDVQARDHSKPANAKAWNKFKLPQVLRKQGLNGIRAILQDMSKASFRMYDAWIPMLLHHISSHDVLQPAELADVSIKLRQAHGTAVNTSDFNVLWQSWVKEEQSSAHPAHQLVRSGQGAAWHDGLPAFQSNGNGQSNGHGTARAINEVLSTLLEKGARADPHTVAITMRRLAKAGASPAKLWEFFRWQVLQQGLAPTAYQLAALMTAYINAGDVYGARRILERGKGLGVRPTLEMYSILITYFTRRQQPSQAYTIMDEMLARKIEPDLHVLTAIAAAYAHRGALAKVKELEAKAYTHNLSKDWPNAAFETLKLRAHVESRDHMQGQLGLKAALDLDLRPDDHLYTFVRNQRSYARNAYNQAAATQQTRLVEDHGKLLEIMSDNMVRIKARMQEARPDDKVASKAKLLSSIDQVIESITENRKVAGGILDDYAEADEKGKSP